MSARLIHPNQVLRPMRRWYVEQVLRWVISEGRLYWIQTRQQEIEEDYTGGDESPGMQVDRELKMARKLLADLKSKGANHVGNTRT